MRRKHFKIGAEGVVTRASELPPPWSIGEAVLAEAFHLVGELGAPNLGALLRRGALLVAFTPAENVEPVGKLIEKYSTIPMGFAGACRSADLLLPCLHLTWLLPAT